MDKSFLHKQIRSVKNSWLQVEQGRIGVATIYLGGGVCGALGASLLQPSLYLVGASAGVYALLTSHLAHLYLVSATKSFSISKKTRISTHINHQRSSAR